MEADFAAQQEAMVKQRAEIDLERQRVGFLLPAGEFTTSVDLIRFTLIEPVSARSKGNGRCYWRPR